MSKDTSSTKHSSQSSSQTVCLEAFMYKNIHIHHVNSFCQVKSQALLDTKAHHVLTIFLYTHFNISTSIFHIIPTHAQMLVSLSHDIVAHLNSLPNGYAWLSQLSPHNHTNSLYLLLITHFFLARLLLWVRRRRGKQGHPLGVH